MRYVKIIFLFLSLTLSYFVSADGVYHPENSVLATGKWYSVKIASDGVYKLTYNDFINLGFTSEDIDFDNISIFGNGGEPINDVNALYTRSDLQENAIYVNKAERYVLFYATATSRTNYNYLDSIFTFSLHRFSDISTYFITFDEHIGEKKRITNKEQITDYDEEFSTAKDYFYHKRELVNIAERGDLWMGEILLPTATDIQIPMTLPNISSSYPAKMEVRMAASVSSNTTFDFKIGNISLGYAGITPVNTSTVYARFTTFAKSLDISTPSNNLNIHFNSTNSIDRAWLDYVLVNYTKNLTYNNSYLRFYSTQRNGEKIRYTIDNVRTNNVMVWDVSDILNVKKIENTTIENSKLSFNVLGDTLRTFVVLSGSSFPTPILGDSVPNQNLHALEPMDFLIVSHKKFLNPADSLANIHRRYDGITVKVVDVQEVYNEFSSGTKDFLAIREFLRMLYSKYKPTEQQPKNILLFGDGTYDNKNILGYDNNYIPTYQAKGTFSTGGEVYTSDDVLACLRDDATNNVRDSLLIGVGRITANDTVEAYNIINKCERYLLKQDLKDGEDGEWRNKVMLTSDDADVMSELYFINNAENIYYQIDETQPCLNVYKIYSDAFKEYTSSSGATYPDATNSINDKMRKGVLLFNYLGHGSYDHLSGERLITKSNIESWNNYNRLPLMITSTCEFARYDMVDKQAAGEYIVSTPGGGGIALIAAARKISSNDGINKNLHRFAVERKADGSTYTFGEVMMNAKNNTSLYTAERSISLIGDPALRISLPKYNIRTLQINNSLYDTTSKMFVTIDTLHALSQIYVKGDIVDFNDNKVTDFNGKINISLYDKKSNYYTLDNSNLGVNLEFELQNNILHKGYTEVNNGEFEYTFIVPKDIAYNYGYAKLSYYANNDSVDAAGYTRDIVLGGINSDVDLSEDRPIINLYMNDTNFVDGAMTDENPSLYAIIYDTIPINTVGSGLGHDIVARLDNAANTFVLNDYYTTDVEDIHKGYITYPFNNLTDGLHTLTLKVWNVYNYSSEATITFKVENSQNKEYVATSYPNPFKERTNLLVKYNQADNVVKAHIRIFNAQGRKLKDIDATPYINTYSVGPIEWDGTCNGGGRVGNGVYYYDVELTTQSGDKITKICKMLVVK
ncbi:MAG: type IX secretion system sortase PorU [Bacteroidales bacterium]|nr:type IX secretion system sortase PorU [Bacteroidales bacterium]